MPAGLPSTYGSQAAYAADLMDDPDNYNMTGWPAWRVNEHNSLLAFIPRSGATKVFCPRSGGANANSGTWNDSANWYPNGVPGANDKVLIGEGVTIIYDLTASSPDIYWIRCDGIWSVPGTDNTDLLVDTFVGTPTSLFRVASKGSRTTAGKTQHIRISASRGNINVTLDTFKQSRGVVWMGATKICGRLPTAGIRVLNQFGPVKGATSLTLSSAPSGWNVGDTILVTPTKNGGWHRNQAQRFFNGWDTDIVTITSISGTTVNFTPALTYDHVAPTLDTTFAGRVQPRAWVLNMSRDIVIETEDAANVPVPQRGHTMNMHTPDTYVSGVLFKNLGRTFKGEIRSGFGNIAANYSVTANVPITMTGYWVTGGVAVFPVEGFITFQDTQMSFPATVTVVGTDGLGNSISETLTLNTGASRNNDLQVVRDANDTRDGLMSRLDTLEPRTDKLFKTVTSITFNKSGRCVPNWIGRSFRMTGSGVRIPVSSTYDEGSSNWVYFPVNAATNIQGRYPFHAHRMGITTDAVKKNATYEGNVVWGAPGWGIAHHESHLNLIKNIVYFTGGANIVAERGNETGLWYGNFCVHAETDQDDFLHKERFMSVWQDPGTGSENYWMTGRSIRFVEDHAFGAEAGYVWNVRLAESASLLVDHQLDQPDARYGGGLVGVDHAPIAHFVDCETAACNKGALVIKANPSQGSDLRSVFTRFLAWSVRGGFEPSYTGHYTFIDCTILRGYDYFNDVTALQSFGWDPGSTSHGQMLINYWIDGTYNGVAGSVGFRTGIDFNHNVASGVWNHPDEFRVVVNPKFIGCVTNYYNQNAYDRILTTGQLQSLNPPCQLSMGTNVSLNKIYVRKGTRKHTDGSDGAVYAWRVNNDDTALLTRSDPLGNDHYPDGIFQDYSYDWGEYDVFDNGNGNTIRRYGYYQSTHDGKNYFFGQEHYTDRSTGEIYMRLMACQFMTTAPDGSNNWGVGDISSSYRGTMNLANMTGPTGADFSVTVPAGQSITFKPTDYCSHPNGRTMVLRGVTRPAMGYVVRNGWETNTLDGTITYIAPFGWTGSETFKYWVADIDGNVTSERGNTITVTVTSESTAFEVFPTYSTTAYNTPVSFNVLTNCTGNTLVLDDVTLQSGGTVTFNSGGSVTYTPTSGYTGTLTGTAAVRETTGASAGQTQTVNWYVTVRAADAGYDPPSVVDASTTATNGRYTYYDILSAMLPGQGQNFLLSLVSTSPEMPYLAWTGTTITFRTATAGSYAVSVTVVNPDGETDTGILTVTASDTPLAAGSFTLTGNAATLTYTPLTTQPYYKMQKFQDFVEQLGKGTHNFSSDTLKMSFTLSAPQSSWTTLSQVPEISASGGYTAGGFALTKTWSETGGIAKLVIDDKTVTATAGGYSFRYVVIYNDTAASKNLIGWFDFGPIIMQSGDSFVADFDPEGVFKLQ